MTVKSSITLVTLIVLQILLVGNTHQLLFYIYNVKNTVRDIQKLELEIISGQLPTLTLQPTILDGIKGSQESNLLLLKLKERVQEGRNAKFNISSNIILYFNGKLCILEDTQLKEKILFEACVTPYLIHPSVTKMYNDLKSNLDS